MDKNTKDCPTDIYGNCCCNCKHLVEVRCHPWNKTIGKGSIMTNLGYGCSVMYPDENINEVQSVIFRESVHGLCEMHNKNEKE